MIAELFFFSAIAAITAIVASHHMETGLIKTILYIRVALTSERLVSRFFHDELSFTKTSMSGAILWAVYKFCPMPKI